MLHSKQTLVPIITLLTIFGVGLLLFNFKQIFGQQKYTISVAVSKTPLSTPFYVAESINAFDDTCVDVNYVPVVGGLIAFERVKIGETDFATSSDSVIAFQSLTTQSFVSHAMFVQSDNDVKLITRIADNVNAISVLKGKKIGVTEGTAGEYLLSTLLAIEGLSMDDVELLHFKPAALVPSFKAGEVDAIVVWEPFAFEARQLFAEKIKIHDTKSLSTLSFNLISHTANSELVEKAKCLIQGLQKAINFIASNPEESKNIVINELDLAPEFIDWVWPDYIFKLGLNQSLLLSIKSQAQWAVDTQMREYKEVPNPEKFIDSRALLQVEAGAVNIPL